MRGQEAEDPELRLQSFRPCIPGMQNTTFRWLDEMSEDGFPKILSGPEKVT